MKPTVGLLSQPNQAGLEPTTKMKNPSAMMTSPKRTRAREGGSCAKVSGRAEGLGSEVIRVNSLANDGASFLRKSHPYRSRNSRAAGENRLICAGRQSYPIPSGQIVTQNRRRNQSRRPRGGRSPPTGRRGQYDRQGSKAKLPRGGFRRRAA